MSEIIRVLSAIKGQQEYYGHNADKINKEGIVLTKRNADTVVKVLEKQIPKKLEKDTVTLSSITGECYDKEIAVCPLCNNIYLSNKQPYCNNCGQKLDWSMDE